MAKSFPRRPYVGDLMRVLPYGEIVKNGKNECAGRISFAGSLLDFVPLMKDYCGEVYEVKEVDQCAATEYVILEGIEYWKWTTDMVVFCDEHAENIANNWLDFVCGGETE